MGLLLAEIDVFIGPLTAIVIGSIAFYLWDRRRAEGDCRDDPTYDVIMSMTSRRRCRHKFLLFVFFNFLF